LEHGAGQGCTATTRYVALVFFTAPAASQGMALWGYESV
jgi:hypothetical protein